MNWFSHHLSEHVTALRTSDLIKLGVLISADVLILFSIASLAIAIERLLGLARARRVEEAEFALLRDACRRDTGPATHTRLAQSEAPCARAVQAGLELLRDLRASPAATAAAAASHNGVTHESQRHDTARELAREAVGQGLEEEGAKLSRNLSLLGTVASTAPYIGLFGTVLGILSAFARIAQTGQTGASVVAAPIAEALTATGLGLGVAIPAVMAYNYLSGRVGDLMLRVETHALDLSARLIGSDGGQHNGASAGTLTGASATSSPVTVSGVPTVTNAAPLPVGASGGAEMARVEAGHAH